MRHDIVVVGAGHAGCEAAAAAARMGAQVLLVTPGPHTIGTMSCNPAIGGVGKGHLVRELDVFDGLMARAADWSGIHYRMLNRSKGAAVHGPRVQADRRRYAEAIRASILRQPGLAVQYGWVEQLQIRQGQVTGVMLGDGSIVPAGAIILTTGTFLGARLFRGELRQAGGRVGEPAATALATQLRDVGLPMARLKTGTPPRLDGRTIDWARLDRQPSDSLPWTMSPLGSGRVAPQLACGITRTNATTHSIIGDGLDRSPLRSGAIEGQGPRYCPSIEDKVVRFAGRDGHQIFLEPESLDSHLVYPNGISTSLPDDVQRAMVRSIAGLERAEIVQPGYAVEYDHVDPRILSDGLAVRDVPGLFCAGQINGTTGYEEAAAQGLVAGLNAAAVISGKPSVQFARGDSYIGVLIDDLILQGVTEPYRMLTSRAEFRLRLRADNAATRLGELACRSGAIGPERQSWLDRRSGDLAEANSFMGSRAGAVLAQQVRQRPIDVVEAIALLPELAAVADVVQEVVDDIRYEPYVGRERAQADRSASDDRVRLDVIEHYADIPGLSNEMVERLERARPATLAAASRIRGITPAALTALLVTARRRAA